MECLHNDRRFWLVSIGLCLIAVGVAVGLKRMPRTVPYWQCSKMYKRYSQIEGIRATYIKDFRVNDTLTLPVTLLEATTDSGWARLQEGFELPVIPKEYEERFLGDSNRIAVRFFPKEMPLIDGKDTLVHDIITISYYKHSIAFIELQSIEQKKSLIHIFINNNMKINNYEQVN